MHINAYKCNSCIFLHTFNLHISADRQASFITIGKKAGILRRGYVEDGQA